MDFFCSIGTELLRWMISAMVQATSLLSEVLAGNTAERKRLDAATVSEFSLRLEQGNVMLAFQPVLALSAVQGAPGGGTTVQGSPQATTQLAAASVPFYPSRCPTYYSAAW